MIKSLHIENIAVIEKTDIDFASGFNVLTGETGAGKSIVIDAINAVLGERTSKDLIRAGCEKAHVTALFGEISDEAKQVLSDNGFEADEDGSLLISRTLSLSGNGVIKINGRSATATILREIGKSLVNIHGQHDNQSLLNPDNHYIYIDRIAENQDIFQEYYKEFKKLNKIRRELISLQTDEDEKKRKIDLLEYQIKELEAADIKLGEIEEIKDKLQIAENAEDTLKSLNEAYYLINGSDETDGAFSLLREAQRSVSSVKGEALNDISSSLIELLSSLEEVTFNIKSKILSPDYLNIDGESLRQRLDTLHRIVLKYGGTEQAALDFLTDAKQQLENISMSEQKEEELSLALEKSTENLIKKAEMLTASRVKAAEKFSNQVTGVLSFLDMPNVTFKVNIESGRYTKTGCDVVEFYIGTNAGEAVKPLHKIASGGELSRVMLSIKSVLADKDDVDTLIFDEIDTGISGRAAGKVGVQLKKVAACRQVVCVTHLAQIAAFAENHLLIEKSIRENRTYTAVKALDYNERINEIARIMSGSEITDNLFNSAKELLDRSI